jgi:hypothetical protein
MARRNQEFQTLRSEGGLLPPDLLRRVIDPRGSLKGARPEDYGLPQGERLNEVITQSWNRLRRHWSEFRAAAAKLPEGEAGTGLTNDKWSLPLLRELGFGLLPTSASPEIAGRTYAISRFFGSVPVHLIGCGLSLDRRAAGVRGAAGGNPHGLVQEVLNRSPDHLWGIVGNGLRMRILRDSQALSRQSFLEFDLEAMFSAEAYSDFVLLWLVAHATRFAPRDGNRSESCWLEEWTKEAQEQGTRALKDLRGSVERALQVLGEGFTSHPKNTDLRESLRSGSLTVADFHGQLLRVVYRLIFLFVAEDRTLEGQPLLHPREDSDAARLARERYATHYGTARLRDLAGKIKGSRHGDLWRQLQILVGALSGEPALEATRRSLALPALGSFLWSPGSTSALNGSELTNHDLLEVLRHLAYTRQGQVLRPVDYMNLGAEELGGVYESLLALTPQISADGACFTFAEFAGNERKTSGSYYTPDSLVQCLLDSALDPVVEEAIKGKSGAEAEKAILGLKVCDPAVGSGHFLVGAAHRLARHLSRVRALAQGESEPSPLLYQHALRDVIGRCLYGVDLNPMAAELCRVSLWLEALEPAKPLSFLDHHIRVGNSLLGTTPELIAGGLPDGAFNPIEGDDKKVCTALKKRNRQERESGQMDLGLQRVEEPRAVYDSLASLSQSINQATDDTLEAIRRKAEQFQRLVVSPEYRHRQQLADAWCAAFVWTKQATARAEPITTDTLHRLDTDSGALSSSQHIELERLASQYQFFHWHVAFPEVFANGGFDCVLGNPPWEKIQIEEQSFFAGKDERISRASSKLRKRLIDELKNENPSLFRVWLDYRRTSSAIDSLLKQSARFPLTGTGKLNTYSLFAELALHALSQRGSVGMVLPVGLITDEGSSQFFGHVVQQRQLSTVLGFENESFVFPDVHHSFKFCLVSMRGKEAPQDSTELAFFCRSVDDAYDPLRRYALNQEDIARLNPNTLTCPIFRNAGEAVLVRHIYRGVPVMVSEIAEPAWKVRIQRVLNSTDDVGLFEVVQADDTRHHRLRCVDGTEREPVYEAKMFHQFDHRFGTYVGQSDAQANQGKLPELSSPQHADSFYFAQPRWWVATNVGDARTRSLFGHEWVIAFRDITSPVVSRTAIAAVLPNFCTTETCRCVFLDEQPHTERALTLLALLNSFALDFVCRTKFSGNHLSTFVVKQLPVPSLEQCAGWLTRLNLPWYWIGDRSLELSYTAWDLEPLALDRGCAIPPFRWADERRLILRCELDAFFFHLYLPVSADGAWRATEDETPGDITSLKQFFPTPRAAVVYIMETFPIVRRKDEEDYGEYRTKRVILDIYDAMQDAIRTGEPYRTRLDPLPGPPRDDDGNYLTYAQIAGNPPPHIHLPREAATASGAALQLSDLASRFPIAPFLLRLSSSGHARARRVRPVQTADIQASDRVVLASANLRSAGSSVSTAIGKLRVEARTDASDDSAYVLVTVRGDDGTAQARFSDEEWRGLTTIGVIDDSDGS